MSAGGGGDADPAALTAVEAMLHHLETAAEPQNIHVEVELGERLDAERLRAAVAAALIVHPLARARLAPWRFSDRGLRWEFPGEPDVDPLVVAECADRDELGHARDRLVGRPIPLETSPPVRFLLALLPQGSALVLSANHSAFDGAGAVRLMRSVARAYEGAPDPVPAVDPLAARTVAAAGDDGPPGPLERARALLPIARRLARRPTWIASEGAVDRPESGVRVRALGTEATAALDPGRLVGGTRNDLLLAACHDAIGRWNQARGARGGELRLMVPWNLRPPELRQELVINLWLAATVSSTPRDRSSAERLSRAVVEQTARAKQDASAARLRAALEAGPALPLWVARALPAVHALTRHRLVETASVSNLGVVEPLSFGPAAASTAMWFSPPARMPKGVSIGALTHGDDLHLAARHCLPQLGPAAADELLGEIAAALTRLG